MKSPLGPLRAFKGIFLRYMRKKGFKTIIFLRYMRKKIEALYDF